MGRHKDRISRRGSSGSSEPDNLSFSKFPHHLQQSDVPPSGSGSVSYTPEQWPARSALGTRPPRAYQADEAMALPQQHNSTAVVDAARPHSPVSDREEKYRKSYTSGSAKKKKKRKRSVSYEDSDSECSDPFCPDRLDAERRRKSKKKKHKRSRNGTPEYKIVSHQHHVQFPTHSHRGDSSDLAAEYQQFDHDRRIRAAADNVPHRSLRIPALMDLSLSSQARPSAHRYPRDDSGSSSPSPPRARLSHSRQAPLLLPATVAYRHRSVAMMGDADGRERLDYGYDDRQQRPYPPPNGVGSNPSRSNVDYERIRNEDYDRRIVADRHNLIGHGDPISSSPSPSPQPSPDPSSPQAESRSVHNRQGLWAGEAGGLRGPARVGRTRELLSPPPPEPYPTQQSRANQGRPVVPLVTHSIPSAPSYQSHSSPTRHLPGSTKRREVDPRGPSPLLDEPVYEPPVAASLARDDYGTEPGDLRGTREHSGSVVRKVRRNNLSTSRDLSADRFNREEDALHNQSSRDDNYYRKQHDDPQAVASVQHRPQAAIVRSAVVVNPGRRRLDPLTLQPPPSKFDRDSLSPQPRCVVDDRRKRSTHREDPIESGRRISTVSGAFDGRFPSPSRGRRDQICAADGTRHDRFVEPHPGPSYDSSSGSDAVCRSSSKLRSSVVRLPEPDSAGRRSSVSRPQQDLTPLDVVRMKLREPSVEVSSRFRSPPHHDRRPPQQSGGGAHVRSAVGSYTGYNQKLSPSPKPSERRSHHRTTARSPELRQYVMPSTEDSDVVKSELVEKLSSDATKSAVVNSKVVAVNNESAQNNSNGQNSKEHIKWLHDRWSKYEQSHIEQSFGKKVAEETLKLNSGDRNNEGSSAGAKSHSGAGSREHSSTGSRSGAHRGRSAADYGEQFRPDTEESNPEDAKRAKFEAEKRLKGRGGLLDDDGRPSLLSKPYFEYAKWKRGDMDTIRMMSFKEYLMSLPYDVDDHDSAMQQYNQYKVKFRKDAYAAFFESHKDDEWFKERYHPVAKAQLANQKTLKVRRRLDVFMQLLVQGWIEGALDFTESRQIRRVMDAAMILMEGGEMIETRFLTDDVYMKEEAVEEEWEQKQLKGEVTSEPEKIEPASEDVPPTPEQLEIMQHARDYSHFVKGKTGLMDEPDELPPPKEQRATFLGKGLFLKSTPSNVPEPTKIHKSVACIISNIPSGVPREEIEIICARAHAGFLRLYHEPPDPQNQYHRSAVASYWHSANLPKIVAKLGEFRLRGLRLKVKEYPLPPERRLKNLDGICADKSIVIRDIQMAKSLIQFLDKKHNLWITVEDSKPTEQEEEGETVAETPAPAVIPPAARGMPIPPGTMPAQVAGSSSSSCVLPTPPPPPPRAVEMQNPLMVNLEPLLQENMAKLVEEEQQKLIMGEPGLPAEPAAIGTHKINRDSNMAKILDRLVMYLRVVHSVDFYGAVHHESEDDMPRRIGVTHIRGTAKSSATPDAINKHITAFEERMKDLFPPETRLADEHIEILGKREPTENHEKWIQEHIVPTVDGLRKCGVCYKRFTTFEFAQMHMREKHPDSLQRLEMEVEFFNNYLADPSRPCAAKFLDSAK